MGLALLKQFLQDSDVDLSHVIILSDYCETEKGVRRASCEGHHTIITLEEHVEKAERAATEYTEYVFHHGSASVGSVQNMLSGFNEFVSIDPHTFLINMKKAMTNE